MNLKNTTSTEHFTTPQARYELFLKWDAKGSLEVAEIRIESPSACLRQSLRTEGEISLVRLLLGVEAVAE